MSLAMWDHTVLPITLHNGRSVKLYSIQSNHLPVGSSSCINNLMYITLFNMSLCLVYLQ